MTRDRLMLGVIGLVVFVLVAVGIVLVVSDSGSKNISAPAATTTSSTTTTTEPSTTTTSTASSTSPTSPTTGTICTTPEEASKALVDAWIAGDQVAAARCAIDAAVTTIFQTSGAGAQYTFKGCIGDETDTPAARQCGYTSPGGPVVLTVAGSATAGWKVQSVSHLAG